MVILVLFLSLCAVDLSALFAQPTTSEINEVLYDWASRPTPAEVVTIESFGMLPSGHFAAVVSHQGTTGKHYGFLRYPRYYTQHFKFPVVVYLHGGTRGFYLSDLSVIDDLTPTSVIGDYFFIVAPSYPGECISAGCLGEYESEGEMSIIDYDVDDTMTLLRSLLAFNPSMLSNNITVYGHSRGGATALIMSARDIQAYQTIETAGPTNWMLPYVQSGIEDHYNNGAPIGVFLVLVRDTVIQPYLDRKIGLHAARIELIRRSPVYFADLMKPVEFHHGEQDVTVLVEHAHALDYALDNTSIYHMCWLYATGSHNPITFDGFGQRIEHFILEPWRRGP